MTQEERAEARNNLTELYNVLQQQLYEAKIELYKIESAIKGVIADMETIQLLENTDEPDESVEAAQ